MITRPSLSRLLIVRNDRLGDLILTLPALQYARKAFPDAKISVLVARRTAPLLKGNQDVDQVLVDDGDTTAAELAGRLKPLRFDASVLIYTNTRNSLAVWRAGIPTRVAWAGKPCGVLLGNRRVWTRRSHPPIHESEFALECVRRLKHDRSVTLTAVSLAVDDAVRRRVETEIRNRLGPDGPLFGVHPGNFNSAVNWPRQCYTELICKLAMQGRVLVTGGPAEQSLLSAMRAELPEDLQAKVAFHHEFDLMQLSAAIAMEDVLTVSNTGPMHLAGIVGTPTVALFGSHVSQSPEKWAPLGAGHIILQAAWPSEDLASSRPDGAKRSLSQISVDEVFAANQRCLAARGCRGIGLSPAAIPSRRP